MPKATISLSSQFTDVVAKNMPEFLAEIKKGIRVKATSAAEELSELKKTHIAIQKWLKNKTTETALIYSLSGSSPDYQAITAELFELDTSSMHIMEASLANYTTELNTIDKVKMGLSPLAALRGKESERREEILDNVETYGASLLKKLETLTSQQTISLEKDIQQGLDDIETLYEFHQNIIAAIDSNDPSAVIGALQAVNEKKIRHGSAIELLDHPLSFSDNTKGFEKIVTLALQHPEQEAEILNGLLRLDDSFQAMMRLQDMISGMDESSEERARLSHYRDLFTGPFLPMPGKRILNLESAPQIGIDRDGDIFLRNFKSEGCVILKEGQGDNISAILQDRDDFVNFGSSYVKPLKANQIFLDNDNDINFSFAGHNSFYVRSGPIENVEMLYKLQTENGYTPIGKRMIDLNGVSAIYSLSPGDLDIDGEPGAGPRLHIGETKVEEIFEMLSKHQDFVKIYQTYINPKQVGKFVINNPGSSVGISFIGSDRGFAREADADQIKALTGKLKANDSYFRIGDTYINMDHIAIAEYSKQDGLKLYDQNLDCHTISNIDPSRAGKLMKELSRRPEIYDMDGVMISLDHIPQMTLSDDNQLYFGAYKHQDFKSVTSQNAERHFADMRQSAQWLNLQRRFRDDPATLDNALASAENWEAAAKNAGYSDAEIASTLPMVTASILYHGTETPGFTPVCKSRPDTNDTSQKTNKCGPDKQDGQHPEAGADAKTISPDP